MFRICVILWCGGIRHQLTTPGWPWQNGRIERLFGTLKQKLDRIEVESRAALNGLLTEFGFWYNAVRPHQHLAGLTPEEAWRGVNPYARAPKAIHWFDAWDGLLPGYYLRHRDSGAVALSKRIARPRQPALPGRNSRVTRATGDTQSATL